MDCSTASALRWECSSTPVLLLSLGLIGDGLGAGKGRANRTRRRECKCHKCSILSFNPVSLRMVVFGAWYRRLIDTRRYRRYGKTIHRAPTLWTIITIYIVGEKQSASTLSRRYKSYSYSEDSSDTIHIYTAFQSNSCSRALTPAAMAARFL